VKSLTDLLTHSPDHVLFSCVAGSRAYGTQTQESDEDIRGLYAVPAAAYLNLDQPLPQLADERGNVIYFSLRRFIELLTVANPNLLELLFMPSDCVQTCTPEMESLIQSRDLFVTRQCGDTHIGYAMSQIKKARGQNKWVNQPKTATPPTKEEFCYVIPRERLQQTEGPTARPLPLLRTNWNLAEYHAARLEHASNMFRLYHYGSSARGVFRGDVLVCESIPEADESTHFAGLLLFNESAWKQSLADHHNYWHWRSERNDARWHQQEAGELDFDAKNMMHTVRLLLSGRSILQTGSPIVRFSGNDLQLLLDIRGGKLSFDQIMAIANDVMADCERLKSTNELPDTCDRSAATRLLKDVTQQWESRTST
jgi:predicted nucleotidyltransferase